MRPFLFVDSWGWLALANEREEPFPAVKEVYRREMEAGSSVVTTEYVLDEVISFLFSKSPVPLAVKYLKELFSSIAGGFIRLERIGPDRFEKAWKMRLKYQDHPRISFTDFTSFVVMQDLSLRRVLTNDRHFEQVNLGFENVP